MGLWDQITGNAGADAARGAAADTYKKQQAATGEIRSYGDTLPGIYGSLAAGYDPSDPSGTGTGGALSRLLQDPSSVRSLPGYQFGQDEGVRAIDHSAAARGMDQSGRTLKDLSRFSTGYADQQYGNQLQRLMALKGAQNSTISQGVQGQLGTQMAGYNGDLSSAGTVGQGDIAAANAQAAGAKNILDLGMKGVGMIAGGMGGGMLGMGASGSSFMGGMMSGAGSNPFNPNGSRNTMAYGY